MYYVICCNGYYLVGETSDKAAALRMARHHVDGDYVCIIKMDGREVGDSIDGYDTPSNEYCPDAATQTGMYDRF